MINGNMMMPSSINSNSHKNIALMDSDSDLEKERPGPGGKDGKPFDASASAQSDFERDLRGNLERKNTNN